MLLTLKWCYRSHWSPTRPISNPMAAVPHLQYCIAYIAGECQLLWSHIYIALHHSPRLAQQEIISSLPSHAVTNSEQTSDSALDGIGVIIAFSRNPAGQASDDRRGWTIIRRYGTSSTNYDIQSSALESISGWLMGQYHSRCHVGTRKEQYSQSQEPQPFSISTTITYLNPMHSPKTCNPVNHCRCTPFSAP